MQLKVAKFGGTSLASAEQFKKIKKIVEEDPTRRYVVASAPGKRSGSDIKVTDLLYSCYEVADKDKERNAVLWLISERFQSIINELDIEFSLDREIEKIDEMLRRSPQKDYLASRGEYLNSKILAKYLGIPFVDAADCIIFDDEGNFKSEETNKKTAELLKTIERAVIPGFYGAKLDGTIQTFSRGGSDVTGAIIARAVEADLYENWTDVSGMLMADPRIVEEPKSIATISYKELREISYMGAAVLHENAVFPVRKSGIPINIRNTNLPEHQGTMIIPDSPELPVQGLITGIAGKKGFTSIAIEKGMMNAEIGFGRKVLQAFEKYNVPFEHLPTGIDTLSVVVNAEVFEPFRDKIQRDIIEAVQPDSITIEEDLAMVAVVGRGMIGTKGAVASILMAVAKAGINLRMIDYGTGEMNVIIGIDNENFEKAIGAIYDEFR